MFIKKINCILPVNTNCGCKYICKYYLNFSSNANNLLSKSLILFF